MKKLIIMVLIATFVAAITSNCTVNDPKHSQKKDVKITSSKPCEKNLGKKGGHRFGHRKYFRIIPQVFN